MSMDHEDQLGRLSDEVGAALAAGESIDLAALAARFGLDANEVRLVVEALRALHDSLEEDFDRPGDLAPPTLPGDYEVGAELGRGGMGIVYRARQRSLDRDVAVKVLRPGDLAFGGAIARFEREARSLARLRHRHIVSIHEVGHTGGFVYFTMDLIEGRSLSQLIDEGGMTTGRAVRLLRQVCSAMTYAHGKGVVHRDLKPANILVDADDDAFVVDFGLARDLGATSEATLSGQLIGTPAYMSPEQALGDRERIGEASDVYALGAILYQCLAGQAPFHGLPFAKLMHAVVEKEPTALRSRNPRVPRDLAVICGKAMAKRPEDRYATVLALAEDLERFAIGKPILARPRSFASRIADGLVRHRRSVVGALIPAAIVLVAVWLFLIPELLRGQRLELANRLFLEGNEDGALVAFESALAGADLEDVDLESAVRHARCLIDAAARSRFGATEAEESHAREQLLKAHRLLQSHRSRSHLEASTEAPRWDLIQDLNYEFHRCQLVGGQLVGFWEGLSIEELDRRLLHDLRGPGRAAALLMVARLWSSNSLWSLPEELEEAIAEILLRRRELPATFQDPVRNALRLGGDRRWMPFQLPKLATALVEVVRDESRDLEERTDAAAYFHHIGAWPVAFHFVRYESHDANGMMPVVENADLARLVTNWDRLAGTSRSEAYALRASFVAEALLEARPGREGEWKPLRGHDLREWLIEHVGFCPRESAIWNTWWERHRTEDPRRWLLEALSWEIAPSKLTTKVLVERLREETDDRETRWLHHLLELTVAESVRLPRPTARTQDLLVAWERALNAVPDQRYTLRLATLAWRDGMPEPFVIWRKRLALGIDETVRWEEQCAPDIDLGESRLEFGRSSRTNSLAPLAFGHFGSASLRWTRDEIEGSVIGWGPRWRSSFAPIHDIAERTERLPPGLVGVVSSRVVSSARENTVVDLLTLGVFEPEGAAADDWNVETWRQAYGRSLERLARLDPKQSVKLGADQLAAHACWLAQPEHREALVQIDDALRGISSMAWREERRRARLLAGDTQALELTASDLQYELLASRGKAPESFWLRLALTAASPELRSAAFDGLRGRALVPAFARTFEARMADASASVPRELVTRARVAREAGQVNLAAGSPWMAALAGVVVLIVYGLSGLISGNRRRTWRHALVLWCASLLLARFTVSLAGIEWNPLWIGHGLNALATWFLFWRARSRWTWAALTLFWTFLLGCWTLEIHAPLPDPIVWWTGGLIVLFTLRSRWRSGERTCPVSAS